MGNWKLILNGNDGVTPSVDLETGERKKSGKRSRNAKAHRPQSRSSSSTCAMTQRNPRPRRQPA